MRIIALFIVLISILLSCGKAELKPADYVNWCDDTENGLVKTYEQGDVILTCQYTTPEYVSLKQSDPDHINEADIIENISWLEDMDHFKLTFQRKGGGNFLRDNYTTLEEFNRRTMYLSYDIRYDLKLVYGRDTSYCAMNHHERTYGNTPYETILLSFPKLSQDKNNTMELIFEDRVFGLGRVKFNFEEELLSELPELIF